MESLSSSLISSTPKPPSNHPLLRGPHLPTKSNAVRFRPAASAKREYGFGFRFGSVDESMIVLRKRIHEMEVAERNYDAPSHWMEWEKRYYTAYGSDVCGFVGLVQTLLMNTRPGLAIGLVGLTAVSVPASALMIWAHLAEAVRAGVLGG